MDTTQQTQDWVQAYLELSELIANRINPLLPDVQEKLHIDLWDDQLSSENTFPMMPFTTFIDIQVQSIETAGGGAQLLNCIIDIILGVDSLSDTFKESDNIPTAFEFANLARKLHNLLQGRVGNNFSALNRVAMGKVHAPQGCRTMSQKYATQIMDYSGCPAVTEVILSDLTPPITIQVQNGTPPATTETLPFTIES